MKNKSDLSIDLEQLKLNIQALGNIGRTTAGLSRPSLSPEDMEARRFVTDLMEKAGLEVAVDRAGNIIGTRRGEDNSLPAIGFGSHIDTVKNAGILDGCYGILSAIEVIRAIDAAGITTNHPLRVLCFTDEEGARFRMLLGSSAAAQLLPEKELSQVTDSAGISFPEAMQRAGYQAEDLTPVSSTLKDMGAFLELHIEQGPVLEAEGISIGIVSQIVGFALLAVTITGTQGHAGTTPMTMRKDPLLGAAEIVLEVNRIAKKTSHTSVGTVGVLLVTPGSSNVIPRRVELTVDLRDVSMDSVQKAVEEVSAVIRKVCAGQGLEVTIREKSKVPPALMGDRAQLAVKDSAEKLRLSWRYMHSGAGHDSQRVSRIVKETGMIFVPSHRGISHSPEEWTDYSQLQNGANVLLSCILNLDSQN